MLWLHRNQEFIDFAATTVSRFSETILHGLSQAKNAATFLVAAFSH